jgi:hypothetical protein
LRSASVSRKQKKLGIFTGCGGLIVLAIAAVVLLGIVGPSSAQLFDFGGFQQRPQSQRGGFGFGGGWFGNNTFDPFQQHTPQPRWYRRQAPPPVREEFSKAPPPEKRETLPQQHILVLGDAMADWLAYGLEDAYSEQPEVGVIRKHKTISGLIRYQPRGEPADWSAAAKGILAIEKPDVIVVMLGLSDRMAIHEPATENTDGNSGTDKKKIDKKADKKDATATPAGKSGAEPDHNPPDDELSGDAVRAEPPVVTPEKHARSPNGVYEFGEERWVELYTKKIDEMIGVLKSKGVPVLWVGLPVVRGPKGTADTLFLDTLYRSAADKAGIIYVDVWVGFVDESGRIMQKGPDFEGQIRQLRSSDGVYFTKPGARKLAHYVEREITRVLRVAPLALPTEPATPDANATPGQPAPRPLAGPIVPLVESSTGADQLLGGPGSRAPAVDALAARTLIKGEALTPPPGRADDFAWPRQEIGAEAPLASASPDGSGDGSALALAPAASRKLKKHRR